MVGVVVDSLRMHKTKEMWDEFLGMLSDVCKRRITEFHTCDFYAGNGLWRGIDGPKRAHIISAILKWWGRRKHHLIFSAVNKEVYKQLMAENNLPEGCNSCWRTAAIHLTLSIQKSHQSIPDNKGHALLLFDRKVEEENHLSEFIFRPPGWTDEYYERSKNDSVLNQIIDIPYFGDSKQVLLIQVADVIAFILRRYAETTEGHISLDYKDEDQRLLDWIGLISDRCYASSALWPSRKPAQIHRIFNRLTPTSLQKICK